MIFFGEIQMRNKRNCCKNLFFAMLLIFGFSNAFGAFIQTPIPVKAKGHFLSDVNGDGFVDKVTVSFLKPVSDDYLKKNLDSLVLIYPDSSFEMRRFVAFPKDLNVSPLDSSMVEYDFSLDKDVAYGVSYFEGSLNSEISVKVCQKENPCVDLALQDSLAPVALKVFLSTNKNEREPDTLKVYFSEPIFNLSSQGSILLYSKDSKNREVEFNEAKVFQESPSVLHLVLPVGSSEKFSVLDTVILSENLVRDSFGNLSKKNGVPLVGVAPFRLLTNSKASFLSSEVKNRPIFELKFENMGHVFSENSLGVAFDLKEEIILKYISSLKKNKENISLDKINIVLDMNVFSHSGSFLTGTLVKIQKEEILLHRGKRVFLLWNFMDGRRRLVGSGAYFVRIGIKVLYENKILYQDRSAEFHSWGVLRR